MNMYSLHLGRAFYPHVSAQPCPMRGIWKMMSWVHVPDSLFLTVSTQNPPRVHWRNLESMFLVVRFPKMSERVQVQGDDIIWSAASGLSSASRWGRSQKREVSCCSLWSLGWASSFFNSAELESNWPEELNDISPCVGDRGYLCPKAPESLAVIQQRAAACCSDSMGRAVELFTVHRPL